MSKPFFEVFPTLKAGEDICNMFEGAQVLKVTTNSDRTFLRVHIVSRHLIQKTLVYEMEHLIKNQLFGRSAVQVEIREKYELSGQYTPENVMAEYLDSFLAELDTRSVVERNMLQNAKCTFEEGNILCMQLVDTVIAQGKKDSLTDYLKGVYAERFGLPIEIRVMYKEPKESTLKYNDMRLQQEVDSILDQVEAVQKQKEEKKQEKEAKLQKEKKLQHAMLEIKKKYGKNAILKGTNFEEGATSVDRNQRIGGHKA